MNKRGDSYFMEKNKIGNFIATKRKEKGLTQLDWIIDCIVSFLYGIVINVGTSLICAIFYIISTAVTRIFILKSSPFGINH